MLPTRPAGSGGRRGRLPAVARALTVPPRLPDLLLALLLALGPAAPLRAGEARAGVHALLRVPRHALLQRQGGRLTPRGRRGHPEGARACLPPPLPLRWCPAGSHRISSSRWHGAFQNTQRLCPAMLALPPVGTPGQRQGAAEGQLRPARVPGAPAAGRALLLLSPALLSCSHAGGLPGTLLSGNALRV